MADEVSSLHHCWHYYKKSKVSSPHSRPDEEVCVNCPSTRPQSTCDYIAPHIYTPIFLLLTSSSSSPPNLRPPNIRILTPQTTRGQLPHITTKHANNHQLRHPRGCLPLYPSLLPVGGPAVRRSTPHPTSHRSAGLGRQILRMAAQSTRDVRIALGRLRLRLHAHERVYLVE